MKLEPTVGLTDPEEVRVLIPLRVSWKRRDQIRRIAGETGRSMNQVIVDALDAVLDWDPS